MKKRIIEIIKVLGITQKEFAECIGISAGGLTEYIKGRSKDLVSSIVANIVINYNINPEWLLTGKGDMFLPISSTKEPIVNEIPADKDRIADVLGYLDKKDIEIIAGHVSFLAFKSNINISQIKKQKSLYKIKSHKDFTIPQIGRIAAGSPFLAEENIEGYFAIPAQLLPKNVNPKNLFALEVSGMSMKNAGIVSGDIVIMEKVVSVNNQIRNGNIVAALIDGEATLKRIFFGDNKAELKAENPDFESKYISETDFTIIQGKLIWVIKRFIDEKEG